MHAEIDHVEEIDQGTAAGKSFVGEPTSEAGDAGATDPLGLAGVDGADCAVVHVARSEERRVGQECRSRRGRYH